MLANVNVISGAVGANPILGLTGGADIFGIVIKSDGTIHISDVNKFYRLNISTMQASLYYTCSSPLSIWGMAGFNDHCLAPVCNASVSIDIVSNQPFCSDPGVQLKANGTGLNNGSYTWTLPDGSSLAAANITARKSGSYIVKYSALPDTCTSKDTIVLQITKTPASRLGADTIICIGTSVTFQPSDITDITSFLWSNGSTAQQLWTDQPGSYWLRVSNTCGSSTDTVIVTSEKLPDISIGRVFEICEYDTIQIRNLLDAPGYQYTWSDNTSGKFMIAEKPGKYWVNVKNMCGVISDTITVKKKTDNCDCYLYIPSAFTPNRDGKNDLLKVLTNCLVTGELFVYNRWGQIMYHTNDLQKGWNGIQNNVLQLSGVFVYHIKYSYKFRPGIFLKKGTFVLIR